MSKGITLKLHGMDDLPTNKGYYLCVTDSGMIADMFFDPEIGRFNCYTPEHISELIICAWAELDELYDCAYKNFGKSYHNWWEGTYVEEEDNDKTTV